MLHSSFSNTIFSNTIEYQCQTPLNLYDAANCERLATQAAIGRHLRILTSPSEVIKTAAIQVQLCEDDYPGWLAITDLEHLKPAQTPYHCQPLSAPDIQSKIPSVIAFTHQAMQTPNEYLWGGTIGPNYDCSGLMQAAFTSVGIWIPRDAYQQEAFTQAISLDILEPGDLIFFGPAAKATHVGLYLGEGRYIHSSGKDQGRNGIGIDTLSNSGDIISQTYYQQLRGVGRIVTNYVPRVIKF